MSEHETPVGPDYGGLIGKQPPSGPGIPTQRCACGMLTLTTPDLHKLRNTCANCTSNAGKQAHKVETPPTWSRRSNRYLTLAVCSFVFLATVWIVTTVSSAESRRHDVVELGS